MGPGEGEALSRVESALEPPMPQHHDLSRSLLALDQTSTLIAVIEMSQASWLVAAIVPGIDRHPLKKIAADEADLGRGCRGGPARRSGRGRRHRAGYVREGLDRYEQPVGLNATRRRGIDSGQR